MTATIIDGKAFAERLRLDIASHVAQLRARGVVPGLAVVLVGDDPASEVYVRNKGKRTREVGMNSFEHKLPADATEAELLSLIDRLNKERTVHGILVQLPLPGHLDARLVINAIDPNKDVDGFHISNVGLLNTSQRSLIPCTPLGCLMMLKDHLGDLSGLDAVVVGRSNIVGKPMSHLLLDAGCTVTTAHRLTRNLAEITRWADIVVVAVGRSELIKGDWIKPGAVVIDVGINRVERDGRVKLVGDVDFEATKSRAGAITPVPGGVGPMTIACLLANTVTACCRINAFSEPRELAA